MARGTGKGSSVVPAKSEIKMQFAYSVQIELEDYLFFASMEKGKVAETAPLIHNYALAYGMGWVSSPYYHGQQAPAYAKQLQPLNEGGMYIYPASPVQVTHRLMQYNTTAESIRMVRGRSLGYPNWGFIRCIRPGSIFQTYALTREPVMFPKQIRLGKWMSQARLTVRECPIDQATGTSCTHLINVQDLQVIPAYFSTLYNLLPTQLIAQAEWEKAVPGYQVRWGNKEKEKVFLPQASFWREPS